MAVVCSPQSPCISNASAKVECDYATEKFEISVAKLKSSETPINRGLTKNFNKKMRLAMCTASRKIQSQNCFLGILQRLFYIAKKPRIIRLLLSATHVSTKGTRVLINVRHQRDRVITTLQGSSIF